MVFLQGTGGSIDVPLPCGIVGVKAIFPGSAAGEVFYRYRHTLLGNALAAALDAGDQVVKDLLDQHRVLAKGAKGALPPGVGDTVCHVHIAFAQAAGPPLAANGVRKFINDIDPGGALDRSSNAQRARPGSKHTGCVVHTKHSLAVLVAAVGHDLHRHKVGAAFRHILQLVQIIGQIRGGGVFPKDQVADKASLQKLGGSGQLLLSKDRAGRLYRCFVQQAALICHWVMVFEPSLKDTWGPCANPR